MCSMVHPVISFIKVLKRMNELSKEFNDVGNVFHAGDGNLHP